MAGPTKRNAPTSADKRAAALRSAKQRIANADQKFEKGDLIDRWTAPFERSSARKDLEKANKMSDAKGVKEDVQTMKGGGIMKGFNSPVRDAAFFKHTTKGK